MAFLQRIYSFIAVKAGFSHFPDFQTNLGPLPSPGPFPIWFHCRRSTKAQFGCFHRNHGRILAINLIQAKTTCKSGNLGNSLNFQVREYYSVNVLICQNFLGFERCWTGVRFPLIGIGGKSGALNSGGKTLWDFLSVGFPALIV